MTKAFRKAQRKMAKIRIGLCGPSGSGKTYSALLIAQGLGSRIALIDTEHSSAELYSDIVEFDTAVLTPPFTPEKYIELIKLAEKENYDTIIIDSLSHAWAGEGGLLDMHDKISRAIHNSFTAWRDVTPLHNKLVDAMIQSKSHIIATMRSKQDYIIVKENDRDMVRKVGLAPIQREGLEYEFSIVFDLTYDHLAVVSKDRTGLFSSRKEPFIPTKETGEIIARWLETGATGEIESSDTALADELIMEAQAITTRERLFKWYEEKRPIIESLNPGLQAQIMDELKVLKKKLEQVAAMSAVHQPHLTP